MKYKTILFDADDTLLDFHLAEYAALKSTLEYFELGCDEYIISEYSRINLSFWKMLELGQIKKDELKVRRFEAFCQRFGFDVLPEKMAEVYMNFLSEQNPLKDGAEDICKKLFGKCRLYVITNGIKFIQSKRLFTSPLIKYFNDVFISDEIGYEKPSVEYFEIVADRIPDFDKESTLVVGDSLTSDIKGGIGFGLDTCWFNPKGKERPEDMDITYEISSLDGLYDIIISE